MRFGIWERRCEILDGSDDGFVGRLVFLCRSSVGGRLTDGWVGLLIVLLD